MKKFVSILSAGLALLIAASCNVKEDFTVLDPSLCTPPVVTSSDVTEDGITVNFTPATLNVKAPVYHALVMKSLDGNPVDVVLGSIEKGGVLTLTPDALSRTLMSLGCEDGDVVSLEMVVRASPQQKQTGNHIGYIESDARISVKDFTVIVPKGSPYINYTMESDWSLIGAMSAYGISWDGDLNMWTDGNGNHVAAHVTLKAGDEVKFRKDLAWAENMGGSFTALDNEFDVTQDGPNIVIDKDGVYDLYLYTGSGKAMVTAAYDPYPEFTEASNWSVIGSLTLHEISWDGDISMISDGTWHVALGVKLDEDDEFKFRQDAAWTVNLGGPFEALDEEFTVVQDGDNIKVGAAGEYDIFVNPGAGTAKVTAASGAKVSSVIGGEEPPTPETVTGWNIIGLNGDWENDVLATQDGNVWTAFITAEGDTEFKWRKDGGWDENYGGVFVELGKPFEAVAGGDNIKVGAGFYKVELNLDDMTITVSSGQVWSLIGDFNEWAGDVDMTLTDGKWVSPVTKISGKFKIRENHGWDNNRGGVFVAVGEPFAAVAGGDDITVEEGNYVVTYDPEAETIVIDETGWGLVGTITGWGNTPDIILKEDGLFLVARNVTLTDSDEIKIRYQSSWDENRGGRTSVGHAVKAIPGGDNIKPGVAGTYDVWYRPDSEVLFVMPAGTVLTYWGVVGTINGWGAPDRIMYENENGQFVYEDLDVTATDELKIRVKEDWDVNRGGTFVELGEPFAVENGGPNFVVGRDATVTVTYDPSAETITLTGEYHGEAPAFPDYIYAIGGDTDWGGVYPLFGKNGHYKGFGYLSQEFKFKPNEANWDGDWECVGEGQIGQGSDNCPAPDPAGYYMIEVDLDAMTYALTLIEGIGIIGPAQAGGWDTDTDMTYNQDGGYWEIKGVSLSADLMKFRANDGWDINWGGALDNLVQGGDNIPVDAGTYDIVLYALCDGKAYATVTPAGGQPAAGITIDGDMSDWEGVQGAAGEGINSVFKVASDEQNIYFYVKRTTERLADIWGGAAYHYYTFDLDNDPTTGVELWGNGPYELLLVIYPYAGSADAPAFGIAAAGTAAPDNYTVDNAVIKGVVTDSGVETEIAVPRSDIMAMPTTPVKVYSWSNKGGGDKLEVTVTL
jgi:hypothetical protein